MINRIKRSLVARAQNVLQVPPAFVGNHGCIRTAASFAAWNQVEGDYLEFGVWQGNSLTQAYRHITAERRSHYRHGYSTPEYLRWKNEEPRFFAFDSFEGIPGGSGQRMVDYAEGSYACSVEAFMENVTAWGVDTELVVPVQGYYEETCSQETRDRLSLDKAAIVMIDCDLYESTVPVLRFLTDLVQQGTIIIFEDWFRFKGDPRMGEQRACNEWLAANPQIELIEYWREGPQAVSFLVNFRD